MTQFRPCIDLHQGAVKQIVGGTLSDDGSQLSTNFIAQESAEYFAELYRKDNLTGGHIIQLGPGNRDAAISALKTWPKGMQLGGGVTDENAQEWLDAGADKVIVTSYLFEKDGRFSWQKLKNITSQIGAENLVIDLSCRRSTKGWTVAMNRWQTLTDLDVTHETLDQLSDYCAEFLIHAADVEGLCSGIDKDLVAHLGQWAGRPMTYAGGVRDLSDVELVNEASDGNVDLTVGSALDIFGGSGISYENLVRWNQRES